MTIEPSSAYKRVMYWLFQVLPTKKTGYFLLTWSDYGLELKRRYEETLARQQSQRGASAAPEGPVPIFRRLLEFTEEIEHEGEKIQVISPHKIRVQQLKNPPSSIQGNDENIHHWLTGKHESGLAQKQLTTYSSHSQTDLIPTYSLPTHEVSN